ncbi:hypothetical protein HC031_09020 [Planosporangium thailandense]|uniref:Uncharacterized protein n=1 Tax=Planosporangium thailandense TaxID=765197 RepID=A0ABX0XVM9_9ACTN|nr:hypothetical protein [Planosporangium thailandense]
MSTPTTAAPPAGHDTDGGVHSGILAGAAALAGTGDTGTDFVSGTSGGVTGGAANAGTAGDNPTATVAAST